MSYGVVQAAGVVATPGGTGGGSSSLSGLSDVSVGTPTNGQVLTWNSASSRWTNQTPTIPQASLATLTDVALTTLTAGQVLSWNGAHWVNTTPTSGGGGGSPFTAPFVVNNTSTQPALNIAANGTGTLGLASSPLSWTSTGFTFTSTVMGNSPLTVVQPPATTPGIWLWQVGGATPSGSSAGCSNGLWVAAGTNASDNALLVQNDGATRNFLQLRGDGSGAIGPSPNQLIWSAGGAFTLTGSATLPGSSGPGSGVFTAPVTMTPTSGVPLTITATAGSSALVVNEAANTPSIFRYPPVTVQGIWKIQLGGGATGDSNDCSNGIYIGAGTTVNDCPLWIQNDAGTTTFFQILGTGAAYLPAIGTTASAANAFFDTTHSNQILVSTSARRWKSNIKALSSAGVREIVKRLRSVTYHSRCEADDPRRMHYGLIAEEVDAVEPGLVNFDSEGRPAGVQYERLSVLLLPLIQELLEARA